MQTKKSKQILDTYLKQATVYLIQICLVYIHYRVLLWRRRWQTHPSAERRVWSFPKHPCKHRHQGQQWHPHQEGVMTLPVLLIFHFLAWILSLCGCLSPLKLIRLVRQVCQKQNRVLPFFRQVSEMVIRYNREHLTVWGNSSNQIVRKCYQEVKHCFLVNNIVLLWL